MITDVLKELETVLKDSRSPLEKLLNPGLDKEALKKRFSKIAGSSINQDLISLYNWRNGTSKMEEVPLNKLQLISLGIFLPLEFATEIYKSLGELLPKTLFPVFGSGDMDCYLVDLHAENGPVYFYSPSVTFEGEEVVYLSLNKMITSINTCFKKGVYKYDSEGTLKIDMAGSVKIIKELNPGVKFWNNNVI